MNERPQEMSDLLADIAHTLNTLKGMGCRGFDCGPNGLKCVNQWGEIPAGTAAVDRLPAARETMADIMADLGQCRRCGLCDSRTQVVFGDGDVNARLVFVGEGPGYDEDKKGVPFVGAAGQLLDKIIEAMGLKRDAVYICNIVKCRPPGNRNPKPGEIEACTPFLERQLRVIQPDFICALGTFAAQTLLKTETPISRLRGDFHQYMGIKVMPTYHPAYLLRNPGKKREVWDDMQKLMHLLGIKPGG